MEKKESLNCVVITYFGKEFSNKDILQLGKSLLNLGVDVQKLSIDRYNEQDLNDFVIEHSFKLLQEKITDNDIKTFNGDKAIVTIMDVVKNVKNKDETIDIFKNMITSYFLDSSNSPDEYKDVVEAIELLQQNPIYHKYIGMDSGYDKFKSDGELKKIFDFYDKCKKLITNI